ncbi:hypothetical protein [Candidatus Halobonum tyrrellensis]|uniref:Uncharacterized protein n=1 Tax=Candidatus Halobonum tyrrellensis G22 TaxID=1324957 RepID=V4J110_9EURY|nr:hypothetical protein [Candidatus Halobonum tyrrellensis]ESP89142.1 hypothetical protein K933_05548 [Candidatus Halobonum tyrrellensis G22]
MAYEEVIERSSAGGGPTAVRIRRLESVEEIEPYRLPPGAETAVDWDRLVADNLLHPPVTVDDVGESSVTAYRGLLRAILREALDERTLETALG